MKRNAGFIALMTVALAFFGVSNLPWKTSGDGTGREQAARAKKLLKPTETVIAELYTACDEIKRRIQPFVNTSRMESWRFPDSCYEPGKAPATKAGSPAPELHFLIAMAPHPVSTHLPLFFDRMIEVIQRAARDEKYSYNSSWFPWDSGSKEYYLLAEQLAAQKAQEKQQTQPGVITFRRATTNEPNTATYGNGLIVFIVSEQPTGGIDQEEFENALAWIKSLGGLTVQRGLRILGPTFSGSLPSLKRALSSPTLAGFDYQGVIDIYSGSVSSEESYGWFQKLIGGSNLGVFQTAMEGDSRIIQRFCTYIKSEGYGLDRIALLSEDETAFGEAPKGEPCYDPDSQKGPIRLSYPRDIATLRSAYQEQSIFNSAKPQPSNGTSATSLRGDLSEPASSEHDTVRSYGGQLTPLAQESSLVAITDILRAQQIQFVVLRSTNSLDQIFLSQFLRRVYPEARVVIDGSDLLFRRGGEGASLRGVMFLTTYPLLTWQQEWTPSMQTSQGRTFPVFEEDVMEGAYIAARELLGPSTALIGNYAPPAWARPSEWSDQYERPATWLSVVGHHQFWPLAVLNEKTLEFDSAADAKHQNQPLSLLEKRKVFSNGEASPLDLQGGLQFVLAVGVLWSVLHWEWCRKGSVAPSTFSFRLAYFAPIVRKQHAVLIAMSSFLIAVGAVVTAFATGLMTWSLDPGATVIETLWLIGLLLVALWACKNNFALDTVAATPPAQGTKEEWHRKVGAVTLGSLALFIVLHSYMVYWSPSFTIANQVPAYWRSAHLLSGVSPLLPQLLLLVGLYVWFWFGLRGLSLFGDDRPLLPKKEDLPVLDDIVHTPLWPMFSREDAGDCVEAAALTLGKKHLQALAAGMIFAFCVFLLALGSVVVRTLGERPFGVMMFFWLTICMALVLADSVQLWITWKRLRALLMYLDRLPLRRTLAGLKGLSWGSVWAVSGNTLAERYRLISRQFESLRHLGNHLVVWVPENTCPAEQAEDVARKERVLEQVAKCQKQGRAFAEWYVKLDDESVANLKEMHEFQEQVAATAGLVAKEILQPAWQHEKDSLIIRRDSATPKDEESGGAPSFETKSIKAHVLAAEEFVVLPYLGFIQNILGRIRTMILGSLFLFVATTLAVASYPFDPLPRLGGAFLVFFVITGGAVVLVYAQMNRDTTLSYITNTSPGELGSRFWLQLVTFGIGPLLGLLTTLFPSITDFVTSWLQPNIQALK
jgi:hypothetical protein